MAEVNVLGFSQAQWDAMSKREKRKANWKYVKQNLVPALLGGSLGASIFAKDPNLKKIGLTVTAIGVSAGIAGIDPTNLKGSFEALKIKGANILKLKQGLTKDQTVGLSILGEQDAVKSALKFIGEGKAQLDTDTGEDYGLEFETPSQLTGAILGAKGVPKATANKVVELVAKQPISKKVKVPVWLQKVWRGVYTNLPQIIASMKEDGLTVPEDFDANDGWDGSIDLQDKIGDGTTDPANPKDPNAPTTILGLTPLNFGLATFAVGATIYGVSQSGGRKRN